MALSIRLVRALDVKKSLLDTGIAPNVKNGFSTVSTMKLAPSVEPGVNSPAEEDGHLRRAFVNRGAGQSRGRPERCN